MQRGLTAGVSPEQMQSKQTFSGRSHSCVFCALVETRWTHPRAATHYLKNIFYWQINHPCSRWCFFISFLFFKKWWKCETYSCQCPWTYFVTWKSGNLTIELIYTNITNYLQQIRDTLHPNPVCKHQSLLVELVQGFQTSQKEWSWAFWNSAIGNIANSFWSHCPLMARAVSPLQFWQAYNI